MDRQVHGAGKPRTAGNKLVPPPYGGSVVERPRLIAALDANFESESSTFVMLTAPAGYGKTYLLSQWFALTTGRGYLTAWCGLTIDDRNPVVLWSTVLDALLWPADGTAPELSAKLAAQFPSMDAQAHSIFIAELFAAMSAYEKPIVLLFDDAHLLEQSPSEAEFIRLLQGVPENVKIAFATRSPLQTHSARISGRLLELTATSLSFTRPETTELFALGGYEPSDLEEIYVAAEGWPAALSLAVLGVRRTESDAPTPIEWDERAILHDYLKHEVFDGLDAEDRDALLTLGVAPITTADLVDAIRGEKRSAQSLRRLALGNGMLHRISTDVNGRTWYRVQPLFGVFLFEQLRDIDAERIPVMSERAAEWHLEFGSALTAIQFAVAPPNAVMVDQILRRRGYELVNDGHSRELLAILPPSTSSAMSGPFARLMAAYAAVTATELDRASELLTVPHAVGLTANDLLEWDWLRYLIEMQRTAAVGADAEVLSPGWSESTLTELPDQLRLAIRRARGLEAVRVGHTNSATNDLRLALAIAENQDDLASTIMSVVGLAGVAATVFDVRTAKSLSEHALELVSHATNQKQGASLSTAHSIAGWAAMELLDFPAARNHSRDALDLAKSGASERVVELATQVFNDVHFDRLQEKRRIAQEFTTSWPSAFLIGSSTASVIVSLHSGLRMAAHLGEWGWSERLLDHARQMVGESYDWQIAHALYLLNSNRSELARTVIEPLMKDEYSERLPLSEIVGWATQAVLETQFHNPFRAHSAIFRSLERADETGGYFEVSRANPKIIAGILASGSGRFGPHEHVARSLLSGQIGDNVLTSGPLTEREKQILAELTTLRTVQEIAQDMLLSVNTVKTHMRGVYRKLDVTSRRRAVAKAERLGLL